MYLTTVNEIKVHGFEKEHMKGLDEKKVIGKSWCNFNLRK